MSLRDKIFFEWEVLPFIFFILPLNVICHTCNIENAYLL